MSITLPNQAKAEFATDVKLAYQGMGKLREAVRTVTGVKASTFRFHKLGKGIANQKSIHENVTPMDVSHTNATATLQQWFAPEYTDFFANEEAPFDERQALVKTVAGSLSRREDQLVLDQLADSVISYTAGQTVASSIGGTDTNLNVAKLREAAEILDDNGAPHEDRFFIAGMSQKKSLLSETEVTSSDYANVKALVGGDVDTFMGFKFIWINDRSAEEGGLPVASSVRECYAIHKDAIGLAIGNDIITDINFIDEKDAYLVKGKMRAGSIAIDTDGLVLVQCDES
jgi:hypothetical protein